MPHMTIDVMREMLPKILELIKCPQLGTKVACAHFIVLSAHYLRMDLEPIAGKIMSGLLNGAFDRNPTVRKNYSEALGQVSAFAKVGGKVTSKPHDNIPKLRNCFCIFGYFEIQTNF